MAELEFESSGLWQSAFGSRPKDRHGTARKSVKQKFFDLRQKVEFLVSQITKDVPGLTVHDLTHLDALWETASLIAGESIKINPAEAYVLGAAILLHDAGMCLAAYPNGLTDLRATPEWRDTVTSLLRQSEREDVSEETVLNPPAATLKIAVGEVLRLLHAQRAKDLPFLEWKDATGHSEPLVEDTNLRTFYGPLIGKIAYSHHVSVGQLEALLGNRLGAYPAFPSEWTVDPITLSCVLRCADAAHIDERRAPRLLNTLIRPGGKSAEHWNFQGKLAKARLETDSLVYTSGPEFELDDAESWWLCYDTITMIDGELNGVDVLLENTARTRFAARRVRGAESPEALAKYVRTKGWTPVDTKLRVSDVPRLVRLFGGAHLYGNDLRIPIRELVQNSSDAIRARRLLQSFTESYGAVAIKIKKESDGYWLEVEDDGVGMSERTMTGSLLDFGRSFWTSDAIKLEFPGLVAKGMVATGRFGVGFFSVFMLGDVVRVTSNRFDAALTAAKTLEFRSGLEARPVLRNATPSEYLQRGGTRVSVRLRDNPYTDGGWLARKDWHNKIHRLSLKLVMGPVCPNLDVQLTVDEGNSSQPCLAPNDWITMEGKKLLARLDRADDAAEKRELSVYGHQLRPLVGKDQKVVGRACIWGAETYASESHGCVTVGGLAAARLIGIGGVLLGVAQTITRDSAMPVVPADVLSAWATEQSNLLSKSSLSSKDKMNALSFVLLCGGEPAELPLMRRGNEYLSAAQFRQELSEKHSIDLFEGEEVEYDEDSDSCHPKDFKEHFESDDTIFFVRKYMPTILTVGIRKWPQCVVQPSYPDRPKNYEELVRNIIAEVWGKDFQEYEDEKLVGFVDGTPINRNVTTFSRSERDDAI
jgi:Histidine kinase-, DNA gyrase B-, and HSP90-like ATPase